MWNVDYNLLPMYKKKGLIPFSDYCMSSNQMGLAYETQILFLKREYPS